MKKKGFTLIELIMVIVIISVVAMISFQTITKKINQSKEKAYNIQFNNFKDSAKNYMLENKSDDKYHLNTICISLKALQNKGYLKKGELKNPKTNEVIDRSKNYIKVKYNLEKNQYEYDFTDNCTEEKLTLASTKIIESEDVKINSETDGLYEQTDAYVYKGVNPNNYIEFNNKIWRIVSIDKETMKIKIINLEDNQQEVKENGFIKDLNSLYETGTTYSEKIKEKIDENSKWNQGVVDSLDSSQVVKSLEKQSNDYNTIGLLNVGEYLDSSLDKECYNKNECSSYLSLGKNYWLLNKTSDNKTWYISDENKIEKAEEKSQLYNIYPCLYLKLDTQIKSGTGTKTDPYKLV